MSDFKKENRTYDNLIQSIKYKNYKYSTPAAGSIYQFGNADIIILAPNKSYSDPNNSSIALIIQHGDNRFLFTGDAGTEAENDILENDLNIKTDVYKVGHHGSKTSTSEAFFNAISPTYAVISCEANNSYGHPHAQTLNTLRMNGVKVYRTDEDGTIIATSDGTNITLDVPVSESWQAGEPIGSSDSSLQHVTPTAVMETTYVLNTKSRIYHSLNCSYLPTTNRVDTIDDKEELLAEGYEPCGRCKP